MGLGIIRGRLALAIAPLSAMVWGGSAQAGNCRYGLQLEGGSNSVTSSRDYEIKKSGLDLGAMLFVRTDAGDGVVGLGLGVSHITVDGKVPNRGIRQESQLDLPFLDLSYLYSFYNNLSAGLSLRAAYGKGADYDVVNTDKVKFVLSPGLVVRYEWADAIYSPALSLAYYQDSSVSERKIESVLLAASVSIGWDQAAESPAVPAQSLSPSPDVPAKADDVLVLTPPTEDLNPANDPKGSEAKLETLTFSFAPKSSLLSRESKAQIKKLAKVLVLHADAWKKIAVSGHSDKSGDPANNKALSQKRAEALCKRLTTRGVPTKKLSCIGEGSDRLLPGLAENAAEQRRIELKFEDYDGAKLEAFKRDIDKALQK